MADVLCQSRISTLCDIYPPYDGIPDEAFLIKELKVNSLAGKTGTINYTSAFEKYDFKLGLH